VKHAKVVDYLNVRVAKAASISLGIVRYWTALGPKSRAPVLAPNAAGDGRWSFVSGRLVPYALINPSNRVCSKNARKRLENFVFFRKC
jgi:hypothetical protein